MIGGYSGTIKIKTVKLPRPQQEPRQSEAAFESPPEIETGSSHKKKKIESIFDDQLIHIHLNACDDERH